MVEAGLIVITAFISPFQKDRDFVNQLFAEGDFWEVYVECPLEICQQRDPNKLYQKAVQQQIENFTGLTSPYEVPKHPDLVLPTAELSVDACVQTILDKLAAHAIIKR
jgi:adenylylsulfate kinase-like enzyme